MFCKISYKIFRKIPVILLFCASLVYGGTLADPFSDKSTGDTLTAAEINTWKNTFRSEFNGNIDANNLKNNAVTTEKLTDDCVTPAKIDEDNTAKFVFKGISVSSLTVTSTAAITMADITTITTSPTFKYGFKASTAVFTYGFTTSTMTTTSTATLAVANITTIENSPTFTYGFSTATGTFTSSVTIQGNILLSAGNTFYLDGGDDTYIFEGAANRIDTVVNGTLVMQTALTRINIFDDFALDPQKKLYFDGGIHTYIAEGSGDLMNFTVGGTSTLQMTPSLMTLQTNTIAQVGVRIGANAVENEIDDSTQGGASTTLYIGNKVIDTSASDQRYKTNIVPTRNGLTLLNQIIVYDYNWRESFDTDSASLHIGTMAQELYALDNSLAKPPTDRDSGLWTIDKDALIGLCIKSIQELNARIEILENRP